ncbi:sensor histidine kinase [Mariniblastus fucicola]|uniref:Sensory histidine kinase CreC n=1 Tax=Mariniblastus fucicola TaxID=980251 RepID=A0A5B9PQ40_9BACT|nr:ATP-binding protein [Mariniblastus fucicola]QEG24591.1 sensory histidine kinase CreC [Mariniblastus fucicola]
MVQLSNNSLSDFVRQVVSGYRNTCESKNVSMVLDLEEVSAPYDRKLVHKAVIAMVENAIEAMPEGGELEATLVNAEYQWELEIADSGRSAEQDAPSINQTNPELPKVLGTETNLHMGTLNQLSVLMNATVQSWNCPLGGTAHVLVVPKPATSNG